MSQVLRIGVIGCAAYYETGASYEKAQVAASLSAMGHEVCFFPVSIHNRATENCVQTMAGFKPDFILLIPHVDEVDPAALRGLNVPIVLLLADDTWRRHFGLQMAEHCDYVLGNAPDSMEAYGAKSVPFEWGVYPPIWVGPREERYDVAFVAQNYTNRQTYIDDLRAAGVSVLLRGRGFPDGGATPEEMGALLRQSKIGLNLSGTSQGNLKQIKIRPFETGAAGAMILTEYAPGIEQRFVQDAEAVFFRSREEMVEKARYYIEHPFERLSIASAGQQRVLREHTLEQRWKVLFKHIGVSA